MYGKAFESQYKGSLVGAGFAVFAVWNYVIANTHHGVIELNAVLLSAILGGPAKEVQKAIEFLCRPDPDSRSKDEDGRRMVKEGQFQYRVVNWGVYQTLKSEEALKEYNRRKQAEHREKKKQEEILKQAMTPAQKATFEKAKEKAYSKHRRNVRREGAIAGGTAAIDHGFQDVKELERDDAQIDSEHNGK